MRIFLNILISVRHHIVGVLLVQYLGIFTVRYDLNSVHNSLPYFLIKLFFFFIFLIRHDIFSFSFNIKKFFIVKNLFGYFYQVSDLLLSIVSRIIKILSVTNQLDEFIVDN